MKADREVGDAGAMRSETVRGSCFTSSEQLTRMDKGPLEAVRSSLPRHERKALMMHPSYNRHCFPGHLPFTLLLPSAVTGHRARCWHKIPPLAKAWH